MRPLPEPDVSLLRCASWDSDQQVAVVFGSEGRTEGTLVYDPYTNTWTRKRPKNEPPLGSHESRSGGNMAYDAARKLHILFGSQFSDERRTWGYDLAHNQWHDLKPKALPPTDRNDAVLAYDSANQVVVAVVRVADTSGGDEAAAHLETWAFDAGKTAWTRMNPPREPDAIGGRSRVMTFVPDQNFVLIDAYVKPTDRVPSVDREHQIWTYRYAAVDALSIPPTQAERRGTQPRVVEDVVVSVVSAKEVRLVWQPPAGSVAAAGYHVERAVVEVFSDDEVVRLRTDTPPLLEPSVGAIKRIGSFTRLTKTPLRETKFVDDTIDLGQPQQVTGEPVWQHRFDRAAFSPKASRIDMPSTLIACEPLATLATKADLRPTF